MNNFDHKKITVICNYRLLQPPSFQIIIRQILHKNSRRWSKAQRFVLNNLGFLSNIHSEVVVYSDYYFTSSHIYVAVILQYMFYHYCLYSSANQCDDVIFPSPEWLITWHYCLRWLAQSSGCRSERPWGKMGDLLQNGMIQMLSQVGQSVNVCRSLITSLIFTGRVQCIVGYISIVLYSAHVNNK